MLRTAFKLCLAVGLVKAEIEVTDGPDQDIMLGLLPNEHYRQVDENF